MAILDGRIVVVSHPHVTLVDSWRHSCCLQQLLDLGRVKVGDSFTLVCVRACMRANVRAGASKRARMSGYCSLFQCSQQCPKERARLIFLYPRVGCHGASFDFGVASGIEGDGVGSGSCLSGEGGDQSVLDKVGGKRPHCASTPWPGANGVNIIL